MRKMMNNKYVDKIEHKLIPIKQQQIILDSQYNN